MLYSINAYHVGHKIVLRDFKAKVKFALIKKEHSYLLYRLDDYSFIFVKEYGSVVFFNCTEKVKTNFFSTLFNLEEKKVKQLPQEKYKIKIDAEKSLSIGFEQIEVPRVTVDIAHIIMLNLAQSVALDYYYLQTSELVESSHVYSKQLEEKGKIKLTRNKMRSYIGKTMNLKNKVAEELYLFDTASLAWNTEELSEIDQKIKEELNIIERHTGLQHNLAVVKESLDLFRDVLQHKHSSLLELTIIILILFEVVNILIVKA